MPTSTEGRREGGTQTTVEIFQPAAVESPGGEQSRNVFYSSSNYGRLKELLNKFAIALSITSTTGTGAATAISGDRRLVGSAVVVDEESTRTTRGLENGGVPNAARGGGIALETFSRDSHQDNNKESECRICQMSSGTDVVINLGCRCKLDLGRAHGVCAETWFRFKGNRRCEICGKIAKNVQITEATDDTDPSREDTSIATNEDLSVDGFGPETGDGERHWRSGVVTFLERNRRQILRTATVAIFCIVVSTVVGFQLYAFFRLFIDHFSHKK